MAEVLQLINGVPRHITIGTAAASIYDETIDVASTISSGTAVTLPSAKTYDSDELEIYLEGQRLEVIKDYNFVGVAPRTQVTFTEDLAEGDSLRFRIDREIGATPSIYDESFNVVQAGAGAGEINVADAETGDPITLPSSKTYDDTELEVWINGTRLQNVNDFNYLGISPRTQLAFTFDLVVGDVVRFRIDRET